MISSCLRNTLGHEDNSGCSWQHHGLCSSVCGHRKQLDAVTCQRQTLPPMHAGPKQTADFLSVNIHHDFTFPASDFQVWVFFCPVISFHALWQKQIANCFVTKCFRLHKIVSLSFLTLSVAVIKEIKRLRNVSKSQTDHYSKRAKKSYFIIYFVLIRCHAAKIYVHENTPKQI